MNTDIYPEQKVRAVSEPVTQQDWHEILPGLKVKALVVDAAKHTIEFLMKVEASWKPGPHRHTCETSLLVLEGSISNRGTRRKYGPGDFFYQEHGNTHVEDMGDDGLTAYVSMRGTSDTLVEFLNSSGETLGTMNVSHFEHLLPQ